MPLTREQAQPGVMVNIPTQKTAGHSDLEKSLARTGGNGKFLFIVTPPDVDGCVGLWGSYPTPAGEWYSIKDLSLYGEQANPTNYPLPEEGFEGNTEDPKPTWEDDKRFDPIVKALEGVESLLRYKNWKYGNSGLEPLGIFSKTSIEDKLLARMDDKVARIKNSPEVRKNDLVDLIGYGILLCAHKGWNDFTELQD